jgi:hypothetical protein
MPATSAGMTELRVASEIAKCPHHGAGIRASSTYPSSRSQPPSQDRPASPRGRTIRRVSFIDAGQVKRVSTKAIGQARMNCVIQMRSHTVVGPSMISDMMPDIKRAIMKVVKICEISAVRLSITRFPFFDGQVPAGAHSAYSHSTIHEEGWCRGFTPVRA